MRSVSDKSAFLTAMKAPVKVLKARAYLPETGGTPIEITSDDDLVSWKLSQDSYFFSSVATQATLVVLGTDWGNLVGHTVQLYFSVQTGSNTWQEVACGVYKITDQAVDVEKEKTTFTMKDVIAQAQGTKYAESSGFTYPTTVSNLATQVSAYYSLTATMASGLPTTTYTISEDLWATINETTLRDVFSQIAGATASICRAKADGSGIEFVATTFPSSVETLTYGEMKKWKLSEKYGQVNTVVLSRQPEEDNILAQDDTMVEQDGNITVKLGNNEILDDDRETLITPILNAVKGMEYYTGEITTTGIGLFEVGDYIYVNDGTNNNKFLVTAVDLTISGSMTEVLKCVAPTEEDTNYAIAGTIYGTIYNTEIKVDKQANQITSIVSRQDQTDETIQNNYTQIIQNEENITITVEAGGGANLIKNSVGYATDDGYLSFWDYGTGATTSTVTSQSSPSSRNAGAVSGNEIDITNATISQTVQLTAGLEYTLSAIVDKPTSGTITLTVSNSRDSQTITYDSAEIVSWKEKSITFTPTMSYVTVTLTASNTTAYITDIMLSEGGKTTWRSASSEIYNMNVQVDIEGVKVSGANSHVEIQPDNFSGYDANGNRVFTLNGETTEVEQLEARSKIVMSPIRVVPINNSTYKGWAFVKEE